MNDDVNCEFIENMIQEKINENTMVVIRWLGDFKASTPVAEFKKSISQLGNVYVQG